MTLDEALAALAGHSHIGRYRTLTSRANPDAESREAYRRLVIDLATRGRWPRRVDEILAEAKAEGIPVQVEPRRGCCG